MKQSNGCSLPVETKNVNNLRGRPYSHDVLAMLVPFPFHVFALLLPCYCHALAMSLACSCHVLTHALALGMASTFQGHTARAYDDQIMEKACSCRGIFIALFLQFVYCSCHVIAMLFPCSCWVLPCSCHAHAVLLRGHGKSMSRAWQEHGQGMARAHLPPSPLHPTSLPLLTPLPPHPALSHTPAHPTPPHPNANTLLPSPPPTTHPSQRPTPHHTHSIPHWDGWGYR
jgi:hypothetical protein